MITAHQHKLSDVLGNSFLHEIPTYQRPYAWEAAEALELFDDVREAAAAGNREPYFLGSIVLIKLKDEKLGQVVDGQQRLTTLTILAAVLRDVAQDPEEKAALGDAVYIKPNAFKNQLEAERLRPHARDRTFFRQAIQIPEATVSVTPPLTPETEAQKLMWGNAVKLRDRVLHLETEERQRLVTYLLNECVLVVVATESRDAAVRIFRVLNDRGRDLSNADIIKADLLEKFQDTGQLNHHADLWRQWETDLTRDGFENLLENLRFIKEKDKNRKALSEAYAIRFDKVSYQGVSDFFCTELAPAKEAYARIADAEVEDFPPVFQGRAREALKGLDLVPNKDWMPAAIAGFLRFGATQPLVETLEKLEGLAWAMQLARRYDTQRLSRYVQVLNGIEICAEAASSALKLTAEESSEAYHTLNGPLYQLFPVRVVRAILERLDRLLAEQPVVWDGAKTVEHILPQSPQENVWDAFDASQRQDVTHKLGNLVLLTQRKNSSASNKPFSDKKNTYFGLIGRTRRIATYASVQELAHYPTWDFPAFQKRHQNHSQRLMDRWNIVAPAKSPLSL